MTPKTGPGNVAAARNSVVTNAYTRPTTPLAASNPATRNDPCLPDKTNEAVAITTTAMPGHGASPARKAPPIAITATNRASVAAANDTASTNLGSLVGVSLWPLFSFIGLGVSRLIDSVRTLDRVTAAAGCNDRARAVRVLATVGQTYSVETRKARLSREWKRRLPGRPYLRMARVMVVFPLALAIVVASCGGASTPTQTPELLLPTASPSPAPTSVPALDPTLCPATVRSSAYQTSDGIGVDGTSEFIMHTERALALLKSRAPDYYSEVLAQIEGVRSVESFSGMCLNTGTYRVGTQTAYAPGFPPDRQVIWYASTIVHDAHHRTRQRAGLPYGGREGELACLARQRDVLAVIDTDTYFRSYVQSLIDGVDDPRNMYWNAPNRHW
jgi:hypothetical protein